MTSKEKQAKIDEMQAQIDKLKEHRRPCGGDDKFAIDALAAVDNRNHKLEVIKGTEATITEKEATIKAFDNREKEESR